MPIPQISDTIHLSDPTAGNANAGNGGDGYGYGNISYSPVAYVSAAQSVEGAHTDIHNGDHLWQTADWDAGGGGAGGLAHANGTLADITNNGSGGAGGAATSNGSLGSMSGGDTAAVAAATTGTQYTELVADQHGTVISGMGGYGGNGNMAQGGDISTALVHTNPSTETTTETTSVSNAFDHFVNAFGDIDLSHIGS